MSAGYGYSIWAVPHNHAEIRSKYKMKHIPHVTLKNNLEKEERTYMNLQCRIECCKQFVWFPPMYKNEHSLKSSGFYCNIYGTPFKMEHTPHMTVWYNYEGPWDVFDDCPESSMATIYSVDTRSSNPEEWKILCTIIS